MPRRLVTTLLLLWAWTSLSSAQEFGQWWWTGSLGVDSRTYENSFGGRATGDYQKNSLTLGLDLNGYIFNPDFARFSLGLDVSLQRTDGTLQENSGEFGFRALLDLFPRGAYPVQVFARHGLFDYDDEGDIYSRIGVPESKSVLGAKVTLLRGALQGTRLGVTHTQTSFAEPDSDDEVEDQVYVDWSRRGKRIDHHYRLDLRNRDYGTVDLTTRDATLTASERGRISENWYWLLNGTGIQRSSEVGGGSFTSTTARVGTTFDRDVGDDMLRLTYTGGLSSTDDSSVTTHDAFVFYQWRLPRNFYLGPVVGYAVQTGGFISVSAPRAGMTASWSASRRNTSFSATANASYQNLTRTSAEGESLTEKDLTFGFFSAAGFGSPRTLRANVEISMVANQVRQAGVGLDELPDLGISTAGLGTEDTVRGRVNLRKSLARVLLDLTLEGRRKESDPDDPTLLAQKVDVLRGSLAASFRRFTVSADYQETDAVVDGEGDNRFESLSSRLTWRVLWNLYLTAIYRDDVRQFEIGPAVDGRRIEVGVRFAAGLLDVEARSWVTRESVGGGPERENRVIYLSATRRFNGLLPIFSRTERRGFIR